MRFEIAVKSPAYPVLVDDINDGHQFALVGSKCNVGDAANLNITLEHLQEKQMCCLMVSLNVPRLNGEYWMEVCYLTLACSIHYNRLSKCCVSVVHSVQTNTDGNTAVKAI